MRQWGKNPNFISSHIPTSDLLVPDAALPCQLLGPRSRPAEAERDLLLAMIERAFRDLHYKTEGTAKGVVIAREARDWLSDRRMHPFSFCWIAEVLGIDAEALRRQAGVL